jgi:redox-sensitive bicupin YhaK (pirin superfamily)
MSWLPSQDPILGDKHSCDALELVIVPRARDIGGFEVRRALPHGKRQMVGPFIFFDQMGPVQFIAGQGMDVRPHPHIGLATVTIFSTAASCIATAKATRSKSRRAR